MAEEMTPQAHELDQALEALRSGRTPAVAGELATLLEVAAQLDGLPAEGLQARLGADLERKVAMITINAGRPTLPEGFRNLTPFLRVADPKRVIAFLARAFGAEELHRSQAPEGGGLSLVRVGDSMLMIRGPVDPPAPTAFHIYVDGVDEVYRRAIEAGASTLSVGGSPGEPADHPYGERSGFVVDPAGNHWYVAERSTSKIVHPEMGAVTPYLHPTGGARMIAFLKEAFGADQIVCHEHGGRVTHAQLRVGASILELGEAGPMAPAMPSFFYLYVGDVDAVYRHGLAAGAKSFGEPSIAPWGDYNAGFIDPFGNYWFPSEFRG